MDPETLRRLQWFHAEAIPANAIRNQGAEGVLDAIRGALKEVDLSGLVADDQATFIDRLGTVTETLTGKMPAGTQHWGTARKAFSLFLRDCTYDHHLRQHHGLEKIEVWLEVPLDNDVARALRKEPEGQRLPRWKGLKGLTEPDNTRYQEAAQRVADRMGVFRVDLDLYWWRAKKKKGPIESR
jgi:hypothetical protein